MLNAIFVSGILAWAVAQIIKTALHAIKFNKVVMERFLGAGGMPSSHTAMVISTLISVGKAEGTASTVFGITCIFGAIVIYDAMGVRYAAGQHAKVLNVINKKLSDDDNEEKPKELKEYLGHTPLEVLGGAVVGIIIGILMPIKG